MMLMLALVAIGATPQTIQPVLARARGGDTVTLAPGDYGEVVLANRIFSPALVLDTRKATLALRLQKVRGLTIRGGVFRADASPNRRGISILDSQHISVLGGSVDGAFDGINMARSSDILVEDFATRGIVSNGVTIAGSQRVTITRLTCRDAAPDPTGRIHPDCVQGFSVAGSMTTDVLVQEVSMSGPTQGIFFGNPAYGYERIRIERNDIATQSAPNGIGIHAACKDCSISGNRVRTLPGSRWPTVIFSKDKSVKQRRNKVG